jgi:hypothetical protein
MQSYYPCEDELWVEPTASNIANFIVPVSAGIYGETKQLVNITDGYIRNNDTDHCVITQCEIL